MRSQFIDGMQAVGLFMLLFSITVAVIYALALSIAVRPKTTMASILLVAVALVFAPVWVPA